MRKPEIVLEVIEKRGTEGKPLDRLYRTLFNREMYVKAYSEIYANEGATPPEIGRDTMDGMSEERIDKIIQKIKTETYKWQAVRRTYIPKDNGVSRPLGVPSGNDKLLQATIKFLLEAYYEPQFSDRSHGFRPNRGCHTALRQIGIKHQGANWFIEGDVKGCFDNIDHETLLGIIGDKIKDGRFLRLLRNLMKAGSVEDWKWHDSYSGTPQGGIVIPLLSNIYLDRLDKWIEEKLMPLYNRKLERGGGARKRNPEYRRLEAKRGKAKKEGNVEAYKHYGKLMKTTPTIVEDDRYRKLEYIRYADDFLLSFAGPKREAEEIKGHIRNFLKRELNLELSDEKTLITHARTGKARFLGYDLKIRQEEEKRTLNGSIWYGVPREVIERATKKYKKQDRVTYRPALLELSDYDIIQQFQTEYRGLVNYYVMAHNIAKLGKVGGMARMSLMKTLAAKHHTRFAKIAKKYMAYRNGYRVIQVEVASKGKPPLTAHFGAVPLKRNPKPYHITGKIPRIWAKRSQLIDRMLAEECEMCGVKGDIEVHHVRKLRDVNKPGRKTKPAWTHRMAAIRRKTLMTCKECHKAIHAGKHRPEWDSWKSTLESRVR